MLSWRERDVMRELPRLTFLQAAWLLVGLIFLLPLMLWDLAGACILDARDWVKGRRGA